MALHLVTAPAIEPISLDEAKVQCHVEVNDDDALLSGLIVAARQYVEVATRRPLMRQTWDWKLDGFPSCDRLILPLPPVSSITSISYVDAAGDSQTWSSALYTTDFPSGPWAQKASVEPIYGGVWPGTRDVINAVTVRFVCGYGTTAATVPDSLRHAMKLLVRHWYDQRSPVLIGTGTSVNTVPLAIDALTWPFTVF